MFAVPKYCHYCPSALVFGIKTAKNRKSVFYWSETDLILPAEFCILLWL